MNPLTKGSETPEPLKFIYFYFAVAPSRGRCQRDFYVFSKI